jgi:N-acetylneuraminic acid mutarotase
MRRSTMLPVFILGLAAACTDGRELTSPEDGLSSSGPLSADLLASSNSWTWKRFMAAARQDVVAATIGNTIYVFGGNNPSNTATTTVQAYNVSTNTWALRKPLPAPRAWLNGASVINGKIYVTGGYGHNTLYVYNPATNTWARKANMPEATGHGAQGAINGILYVYAHAIRSNRFWRYNPATDKWTSASRPTSGHAGGAAGVIGGKFYLASGEDLSLGQSVLTTGVLEVYNPATNTWTTKAPMPNPRSFVASAVLGQKLYVAGGEPWGGSPVGSLNVYDPATNSWATRAPLPLGRSDAAGAAANGQFFVMGGRFEDGTTRAKVDAYTP